MALAACLPAWCWVSAASLSLLCSCYARLSAEGAAGEPAHPPPLPPAGSPPRGRASLAGRRLAPPLLPPWLPPSTRRPSRRRRMPGSGGGWPPRAADLNRRTLGRHPLRPRASVSRLVRPFGLRFGVGVDGLDRFRIRVRRRGLQGPAQFRFQAKRERARSPSGLRLAPEIQARPLGLRLAPERALRLPT